MCDLLTPQVPVSEWTLKKSFALQVAGAHGGCHESEVLSLEQERHDHALKELHQQVEH